MAFTKDVGRIRKSYWDCIDKDQFFVRPDDKFASVSDREFCAQEVEKVGMRFKIGFDCFEWEKKTLLFVSKGIENGIMLSAT